MITSSSNPRLKLVRSLLRDRRRRAAARQWCLEGVRLVEEALQAGMSVDFAVYAPDVLDGRRGLALLDALRQRGVPCEAVSEPLLHSLSDTVTTQGILAVAPWPSPQPLNPAGLLLVLDRVADPGNLGTILRTALAAGCAGVVLTPGSVDLFNPKVVRAAMGAHCRLPLLAVSDDQELATALSGRVVRLADSQGTVLYDEVDWLPPSALIIGSEARGAADFSRSLAREGVSIPLQHMESLNAAAAAAILCFEAVRQRRQAERGRRLAA